MADLFNRNVSNLAGTFTSDAAKLTFTQGLNTLVQRAQVSYQQTVTRLYEVGSSNIYYVGGRTMGQMALDRVIGPASTVCAFYTAYGDVCQANGNNIQLTLQTNCSTGSAAATNTGTPTVLTLNNVVITGVSMGVTAQEMIISDNTSLIYTSLTCTGGAALQANAPAAAGNSAPTAQTYSAGAS